MYVLMSGREVPEVEFETITELIDYLTDQGGEEVAILSLAMDDSAGVSREIEEQARELTTNGYDITLFVLEGKDNPPEGVGLEVIGSSENFYLQKLNQLFHPLRPFTTVGLIRQLRSFDVLIAHRYPLTVPAYLTSRYYSVPYVAWHYHIPDPKSMGTLPRRAFMHALEYLEERSILIRDADVVCSITESSRQMLLDSAGVDSLVITNDTVANRFHGVTADQATVEAKYGVTAGEPVVLFVGRLTDTKNVVELIEIFNDVRETVPEAKLVVAGKPTAPDYFERLENAAGENTVFTGFVSDEELLALYEICDVYATCSIREGRNLPAGEAQAYGADVIGFNVPGNEDTIKQGALIEPGNYDAFATEVVNAFRKAGY